MSSPLASPFTAEHYATLDRLSDVIAPPYDVISPDKRRALTELSEYNIVRFILPDGDEQRYERAAALLERWRSDGVLIRDSKPALYVVRQTFVTKDGASHSRTGVIGAVLAEAFENGLVKPHEKTHAGPKEDRLALLRASRATFEALFMVSRDESGELQERLAAAVKKKATAEGVLDGVEITMWRVQGSVAAQLANAASREPLYIADGHHRYETAVAYRSEEPSADRLPVHIVPLSDPGLVVLATHRIVPGEAVDRGKLIDGLRDRFQIRELPSTASYTDELESIRSRGTACVVVLKDGPAFEALLKGGASLGDLPFANEPTVAALDVARVDALVVSLIQEQIGAKSVSYSPHAGEVIDVVSGGQAAAGVLLNPTRVEDVLNVADAGAVMPQKSTYFVPKVPSGLVGMTY